MIDQKSLRGKLASRKMPLDLGGYNHEFYTKGNVFIYEG
jgi:hypothetical protein